MKESFQNYLEEPSEETFLALRKEYLAIPDLNPYSGELDKVGSLMSDERYDEVVELISDNLYPNHFLSPGAHLNLGFAHHKMGNEKNSEMEQMMSAMLMQGILSTGDGSEKNPFLVTRTSDEYDYLFAEDLTFARQRLVSVDGREIDIIETKEDREIHFDVTEIQEVLSQRIDIPAAE